MRLSVKVRESSYWNISIKVGENGLTDYCKEKEMKTLDVSKEMRSIKLKKGCNPLNFK